MRGLRIYAPVVVFGAWTIVIGANAMHAWPVTTAALVTVVGAMMLCVPELVRSYSDEWRKGKHR